MTSGLGWVHASDMNPPVNETKLRCKTYGKGNVVNVVQIISNNLALDQFMPPAQRNALNAAKHWMAEEWPRRFGLKPLTRDKFLAPQAFLSGSDNNTSNPVHKREKYGRAGPPNCPAACCAPCVTDTPACCNMPLLSWKSTSL